MSKKPIIKRPLVKTHRPVQVKGGPRPVQPDYQLDINLQPDTQERVVAALFDLLKAFNSRFHSIYASYKGNRNNSQENPEYTIHILMFKRSGALTEDALIILSRFITENEIRLKAALPDDESY